MSGSSAKIDFHEAFAVFGPAPVLQQPVRDELLDGLDAESFSKLSTAILDKSLPWTVVLTTRDHDVTQKCDQLIELAPCHLSDGTSPTSK